MCSAFQRTLISLQDDCMLVILLIIAFLEVRIWASIEMVATPLRYTTCRCRLDFYLLWRLHEMYFHFKTRNMKNVLSQISGFARIVCGKKSLKEGRGRICPSITLGRSIQPQNIWNVCNHWSYIQRGSSSKSMQYFGATPGNQGHSFTRLTLCHQLSLALSPQSAPFLYAFETTL